MRRLLSVTLVLSVLLTGCAANVAEQTSIHSEEIITSLESETSSTDSSTIFELEDFAVDPESFDSLSDPELLSYVEDNVYATLEETFASDDYEIINVNAVYISQEYIDELTYNSQENIYFGYTLSEIEAQFEDPYIFTVGEDGSTTVQIAQAYDDSFNEIVRNVAVGAGVILICVTVSVVSGGLAGAGVAGATVVNTVFATAAKGAVTYALANGAISGVAAGLVTGCQTGDYQAAIDAGVYAASEGFMWGAISGAIIGGASGYIEATWMKPSTEIPSPYESETNIATSLGVDETQVSFIGGEQVPYGTTGSTRPDGIIWNEDGSVIAYEFKRYDLENNLPNLVNELERQVGQRLVDLPAGSTQEIIIDVTGRGYTAEFLSGVESYLSSALYDVYPNIPITFFGV